MSVKIRPYRKGGWEVDIHVVAPDGKRRLRERRRLKMSARSVALRWAEGRERVLFERLLSPALDKPKKEVPTLQAFAPRFIEGHAIANRLKPSSIAAKKAILRLYLFPMFGRRRLDAIKNEDVQRLKAQLELKAAQDREQRPQRAQRAAEARGRVGSDRRDAVHREAAAGG